MLGAVSKRRIRLIGLIALFSSRVVAFQQPAFQEALQPPLIPSNQSIRIADGSFPTSLLPFEVSRGSGDHSNTSFPFGKEDLSYNMTCRMDTYGNGDIICRGAYLDPNVRVYRRTYTRGFIPTPGLRSWLRIEPDLTLTEVEAGSGIEFHYDTSGLLAIIRDQNGRNIIIDRNSAGKVTQVSDGTGRSIIFTYVGDLITRASFSAGGDIFYEYISTNLGQKLSRMTNLSGEISSWTYDSAGQLSSSLDPRSGRYSYDVDHANMIAIVRDSDGAVISTARIDTQSYLSGNSSNSLGLQSVALRDYRGLITKETSTRGQLMITEYDAAGNPIIIRSNYDTIIMRFVDYGFPTLITHSLGESISYLYDTSFRLVNIIYPAGDTETFLYDTRGNILLHRLPSSGLVSSVYDGNGNRIFSEDPDGIATEFDYNSMGFVITRKSCTTCGGEGGAEYLGYNTFGYLTSSGNGYDTTVISVDSMGRQLAMVFPGGGRRITTWASEGPASVSNNVTGETITYTYKSGRLVSMLDVAGAKTEFAYMPSGVLSSFRSPLGDITTYGYDSAANLTNVAFPTNPLGSPLRTYGNDSENRQVKCIRETGDVIDYSLDALGRLIQRKANLTTVATLSYDSRGFLAQTVDPLGTMTYIRNAIGQATKLTHPSGVILNYEYSGAGRLKGISTTGYSSNIGYDSHGRLRSVGTNAGDITFAYDLAGHVSTMTYPNGMMAIYSYGATASTNRIEYRNVGAETIYFSISRDSLTRITSAFRSDIGETMSVGYNPQGEIVQADIQRLSDTLSYVYVFDSAGNRIRYIANSDTTIYSYDPGNLLDTGGVDYSYNIAGEVVDIGSRSISYTAEGMLRTDSTTQGTVTYDYDALGRRQRSVVGGTMKWRLWDESQNEIIDVDEGGNISEFRYFVPGQMDALLGFTRGLHTYFTLSDAAGNVSIVVSETGAIVARYAYEPFRLRAADSFDSIGCVFRFATRREEASGEIYVRARSLESATGRFMQRDPRFLGDNQQPLSWQGYIYANNDPITFSDPSGASSEYDCFNANCVSTGISLRTIWDNNWGDCKPSLIPGKYFHKKNGQRGLFHWLVCYGLDADEHDCSYDEYEPIFTWTVSKTESCTP